MKNLPVPVKSLSCTKRRRKITIKEGKKSNQTNKVSETEIEEMFDVADTDRDGIIGYPEFMVRTKKKSCFGHNGKDHDQDNHETMLNPPWTFPRHIVAMEKKIMIMITVRQC